MSYHKQKKTASGEQKKMSSPKLKNTASHNLKKNLGRKVVQVLVGEEAEEFGVHKELICYHSPFFKAVVMSGFEETETGIMKLSADTSVETFQLFYVWLYTQSLGRDDDEPEDLMRLYIFADMARVVKLKNQCLYAIKRASDRENSIAADMLTFV